MAGDETRLTSSCGSRGVVRHAGYRPVAMPPVSGRGYFLIFRCKTKGGSIKKLIFAFGIGIGGFLKKMLEEPFDAFTFSPVAASVCQLGLMLAAPARVTIASPFASRRTEWDR
jgi:hypothetical protein